MAEDIEVLNTEQLKVTESSAVVYRKQDLLRQKQNLEVELARVNSLLSNFE